MEDATAGTPPPPPTRPAPARYPPEPSADSEKQVPPAVAETGAPDGGLEPFKVEHEETPSPPSPMLPPSDGPCPPAEIGVAEAMAATGPAAVVAGVSEEGVASRVEASGLQSPEEISKGEDGGEQPLYPVPSRNPVSETPGKIGEVEEEEEIRSAQQSAAPRSGEESPKEGVEVQPPCLTPARQQTSEDLEEAVEDEAGAPPPTSPPRLAEASRLRSLAEEKYRSGAPVKSALKYAKRALRLAPDLDGLPQMVTALRVLRAPTDDHYRTLLLEPFSHVNTVRRQYKVLALALHPDKNAASLSAFPGSEEAFKRVGEAFQVLSDRSRRKEYDLRLRLELETASSKEQADEAGAAAVDTFWTACTTCRLFHQFDRRYIGQRLLCPRCKKSFQAVEVKTNGSDESEERDEKSASAAATNSSVRATRSAKSARMSVSPSRPRAPTVSRAPRSPRPARSSRPANKIGIPASPKVAMQSKRKASIRGPSEEPNPNKRVKEKTLAEMQLELKKKSTSKSISPGAKEEKEKNKALVPTKSAARDMRAMTVEDSDFYDFDKHRTEKSFRKGQLWAIYDDDDGMPRHYGLIHEVFSTHPFRLKMSWLDVQSNGDEALLAWEKHGLHISCGRFKLGRIVDIDSVNLFSHLVECERAAKELYRIYPKKGSVWALYSEGTLAGGEEQRHYDVVMLLTSYSEMYGLSMAYLVKVEGYKTIFKRREIGVHAVKWVGKDGTRVFSHQIPARKLTGSEGFDLPNDCWELDPASLPPDLLRIDWKA